MTPLEIKEFRKRNNLTQDTLAEIVKVGVGTVKSWEQGKRNVSKSSVLLMDLYEKANNVSVIDIPKNTSELDKLYNIISEQGSNISRLINDNSKLIEIIYNQSKKTEVVRTDAKVADAG